MGLYGVCTCVVILLARGAGAAAGARYLIARGAGAAAGAGHLIAHGAAPLFTRGACSVPSLCQQISPLG